MNQTTFSSNISSNIMQNSTRDYYEQCAYDYFLKTYNANIYYLWNMLGDQKEGSLLLDLGCGSGRDLLHFTGKKIKTIGIDISYNLLKCAQNYSNRPVFQANMISLPFKDRSFNVVWAIGTLLHIPREQMNLALSEIHRVLKRRSVLIASIKKGNGEELDGLGRYFVYYDKYEWADILVRNNFKIELLGENKEARGAEKIDWIVSVSKTP